jgi:uncharacterized DUF497 family protein
MDFEWDEGKRLSNIRKHGLDFTDAMDLFYDINSKIFLDQKDDYGEIRYTLLAIDDKGVINEVNYTLRNEDKNIRIISFRKATKKEMEDYYGN